VCARAHVCVCVCVSVRATIFKYHLYDRSNDANCICRLHRLCIEHTRKILWKSKRRLLSTKYSAYISTKMTGLNFAPSYPSFLFLKTWIFRERKSRSITTICCFESYLGVGPWYRYMDHRVDIVWHIEFGCSVTWGETKDGNRVWGCREGWRAFMAKVRKRAKAAGKRRVAIVRKFDILTARLTSLSSWSAEYPSRDIGGSREDLLYCRLMYERILFYRRWKQCRDIRVYSGQ